MEPFLQYDAVSASQYFHLSNVFSFTFAAFFASAIGLLLFLTVVDKQYRGAVIIAGLVPLIAAYHYWQIGLSWDAAYDWTADGIQHTAYPFNVAYRYADWLLTVPLLMIELVEILKLRGGKGCRLATKLALAAALMIALGYPGETAGSAGVAWTFWVLSMIPFLGIFWYLVTGYGKHLADQPEQARGYLSGARWLTAAIWWVYPIVFLFPLIGWTTGSSIVTMNTLFAIADITAKSGLGILIVAAAVAKSRAEAGGAGHGISGGAHG
jgi:bacteriorhodopsin